MNHLKIAVTLLVLAGIAASTTVIAEIDGSSVCAYRQRIDLILNTRIVPGVQDELHEIGRHDLVTQIFDIIQPWAISIAVGDYYLARSQSGPVITGLEGLLSELEPKVADNRQARYAHLLLTATLARVNLVNYEWGRAIHYGHLAREDLFWFESRYPDDSRSLIFRGMYEYYVGVAPVWLKSVGWLLGVNGNKSEGVRYLEAAVTANGPLAPEAARMLFAEVRNADRESCRYLGLAADLTEFYPDNAEFQWYLVRELRRCDALETPIKDAPRLDPPCISTHRQVSADRSF